MNSDRKIAEASIILIIGNSLAYFLGFAKEILVAAKFGVSGQMDAFYAAVTIPTLLINTLLAVFNALFIPIFCKFRSDEPESDRLTSIMVNYILVFLAAGFLLIFAGSDLIAKMIAPGLSKELLGQASKLTREISFMVLFSGMAGILATILNAKKHFTATAFSSIFVTAAIAASVLVLSGKSGVSSISYGLAAGSFLQFVFLAGALYAKGYRHKFRLFGGHAGLKGIGHLSFDFLAITVVGQIGTIIDRVMASGLAQGNIAALGYADKLVRVPSQIFNSSITTAAFPFFSDHAAAGKLDELNKSLTATIRMAAFILIPATAMLIVLSKPLVKLLFERGAFTPEATALISGIFALYTLQLFFAAVAVLLSKVFFAFQDIRSIAHLSIMAVALKAGLNLTLMRLVTPAAAGIALATSLTEAVIMLAMLVVLRKKLGRLSLTGALDAVARITAASAAAALIMIAAKEYFSVSSFTNRIFNQTADIFALTALGTLTYVIICHWLRIHELGKIKWLSLRMLNRQTGRPEAFK